MNGTETIRRCITIFLLVVFALSATPKVVFHEVLAGHKDGLVCQDKDKHAPHLHQPAYHCAFDDLVVSSPYLSFELRGAPEPPVCYYLVSSRFITCTLSMPFLRQESRGPPTA